LSSIFYPRSSPLGVLCASVVSSLLPMPTVWIPPPLRDLTAGQETVRVPGSTVLQVIEALDRLYPGARDRLCGGEARRSGIAVAAATQLAPLGLLQPVADGSEVHFLPALSGG